MLELLALENAMAMGCQFEFSIVRIFLKAMYNGVDYVSRFDYLIHSCISYLNTSIEFWTNNSSSSCYILVEVSIHEIMPFGVFTVNHFRDGIIPYCVF